MSQFPVTDQIRLETFVMRAINEGWTLQRLAEEAKVGVDAARNRLLEIRQNSQREVARNVTQLSADAASVLIARANSDLEFIMGLGETVSLDGKTEGRFDRALRRVQTVLRILNIRGDALPNNPLTGVSEPEPAGNSVVLSRRAPDLENAEDVTQ